jgi:hypothetical protein
MGEQIRYNGQVKADRIKALKRSKSMGTYSDIDKHTHALIFLGTPHHGSGTANWGKLVASVVNVVKTTNTNYLDTLKGRSQSLADLDDDFVPLLRDGMFKIFSVYETKKTPVRLLGVPILRSVLVGQNSLTRYYSILTYNYI